MSGQKALIQKAKNLFYKTIHETDPNDQYNLWHHVPEMEKWSKRLLELYPEADKTVVLMAVWFHDIAHYLWKKEGDDHAVMGEDLFRDFCAKENIDQTLTNKVAHCVRAHRNRDVAPETFEAKIVACADSASHMTGIVYVDMVSRHRDSDYIYGKIERDFRDLAPFPEIQNELKEVYLDWKKLLTDLLKLPLEKN